METLSSQDVLPPSTTPTTLRRRAHTSWSTAAAAADGNGNAAMVSPDQSLSRRRRPTANTNAAVGADDDGNDDCHLSSCSSSSLGGSSSVSGSSDFHRGALLQQGGQYYARHHRQPQHHARPLQQPQLHRRHTYAGGPIATAAAAAAAAKTPPQQQQQHRQSIAIEIPVAMKEVVIRHSRSRLLRGDAANNGTDNNDNDDEASTLSSLEVDLGHGLGIGVGLGTGLGIGLGGPTEQQQQQEDDPRRRYWTERRHGASHNTPNATTTTSSSCVYSSTNALCGDDDDQQQHDLDLHVDDDEPSYMSYSLSTSSPCKSSAMNRPCSGGGGSSRVGGGAARNHHQYHHHQTNRKSPGHLKSQSRDSSFLGGLGLLDVSTAPVAASGEGTKSNTVYNAEGGGLSASPSHHNSDPSFRLHVVGQDHRSCHRAAPQAQRPAPVHDVGVATTGTAAEKLAVVVNQCPQKRNRCHRRHFSESCLLNASIGTDTDTTADSSHCLSHHHTHNKNIIGTSFGPPQFSGSSKSDGITGNYGDNNNNGRSGKKRMHRRCASAGCGV